MNLLLIRWRPLLLSSFCLIIVLLVCGSEGTAQKQKEKTGTVTVHITAKPANTFLPIQALGVGVDGYEKGDVAKIYTPANIKAMRSTGFGPLSYRLRTELGVEAWHWNPEGVWSDPEHQQGYWTSNDHSDNPLLVCYGYSLPRRGNTLDQANNQGYSRLDDGDPETFWKSSPYLDKHYTGEDNGLHPQWVVIDLRTRQPINAVRILWGVPYATRYQVEYWEGADPLYLNENPSGNWKAFPRGRVRDGQGGEALLRVANTPLTVRYVRLLLTEASGKAPEGSQDIRDGLGYAIRELYVGTLDTQERFQDVVRHGKRADKQTWMFTSSTDPWHRATDLDKDVEQPGFDRLFQSGMTNGLPLLTPVPLLYDTPENVAAEIRFLKSRAYPVSRMEMGEEPDGQYITPEDYAALYLQWAEAIHQVEPSLQLGGPSFQSSAFGWRAWADRTGNTSWMSRFLQYLRARNRLQDFSFFSFEWYPAVNLCRPAAPLLALAPQMLANVMQRIARDGVPHNIPWIITEYGYSAFAGQAQVEMPAALLHTEITGQFLTLGGSTAYLYGIEPNILVREFPECDTWGNQIVFLSDRERRIRCPLPTYYAAQMLTQQWVLPGDQPHQIYTAESDIHNAKGQPLVTAYAVHRPDNQWAVFLLNKDPERAYTVQVQFQKADSPTPSFWKGELTLIQYSEEQYHWLANGRKGYPKRNRPPQQTRLHSGLKQWIHLPPYSLSLVRGQLGG